VLAAERLSKKFESSANLSTHYFSCLLSQSASLSARSLLNYFTVSQSCRDPLDVTDDDVSNDKDDDDYLIVMTLMTTHLQPSIA